MIDQKIYLSYYIKMSTKLNHTRSITYGDQLKNIPISSSPDSYDRISDIRLGLSVFRSLQFIVSNTKRISCPRKRRKAIGKQLSHVVMSSLTRLPRALILSHKALQDQLDVIRETFRKEPITGFKKPDSLDKQEPKSDN